MHHFRGRQLREIDFTNAFPIGDFRAVDFFGDGSFYLLDSPGVCIPPAMVPIGQETDETFRFSMPLGTCVP